MQRSPLAILAIISLSAVTLTSGCVSGGDNKKRTVSVDHEVPKGEAFAWEHDVRDARREASTTGDASASSGSSSSAATVNEPTEAKRFQKARFDRQVWRDGAWVSDPTAAMAYEDKVNGERAKAKADSQELARTRAGDPALKEANRRIRLAEVDGSMLIPTTSEGLSPMNFVTGAKSKDGVFSTPGRFSAQKYAESCRRYNLSCSARISMLRGVYAHFLGFTKNHDSSHRVAAGAGLADVDELLSNMAGARHEAFKLAIGSATPAAPDALGECEPEEPK